MKARVPVLINDAQVVARKGGLSLAEDFVVEGEDVFLDGPVCRRLAVIDFDPKTGALVPGARFVPAPAPDQPGSYELPRGLDAEDPAFIQAAVFGGVYKTLATFEEPDALGRRIDWAFDGPQLLIVPRAGNWANAFYERDSRSIQFFQFVPDGGARPVLTSQSQDIIAHETAHAIIDGVAPDLYHAAHPQALAIHEAIADIATLLMAFRSRSLAARVLEMTGGSIATPSAFSSVAEQFGSALDDSRHALRNLLNDRRLDPKSADPHALSEVLSGALYAVMVRMYDALRQREPLAEPKLAAAAEYHQYASDKTVDPGRGSNDFRALFIASERFKRMVLRALDYLPPGEVSFADFARALIASDQASHPEAGQPRSWFSDELVTRGVVASAAELEVRTGFDEPAIAKLDLEELCQSDWLAYRFADKSRDLLGIPRRIPFEVWPRLDVTKRYYHRGDEASNVRELLFKVSWSEVEPNASLDGLPERRRLVRGTTLAIDWEKRQVRALLSSEPAERGRAARDAFVSGLLERGELALGDAALAPDGRAFGAVIPAYAIDDTLRLRCTARALHVTRSR